MRSEPTFLGVVRRVIGAKLLVELSTEILSENPIVHGRLYRLGQVGSFVRIPLGFLNLFGVVSMVGASEFVIQPNADYPTSLPSAQRWMEVQLVGEAYTAGPFERGVSVFPTLDDEVHVVTEPDLAIVYASNAAAPVNIGVQSSSENLPATIDMEKLVTRHAAILGSTGSGKSNTVAAMLKALSAGGYPGARVVVIDPHGEYGSAFQGISKAFRIGSATDSLLVPYWAMSFDELGWFFINRTAASESLQEAAFRSKIFELRKGACSTLKSGPVPDSEITVDSPIPFNIRELWYYFDRQERATFQDGQCTTEALIQDGNPATLTSAQFQPHTTMNTAPFKNKAAIGITSQMARLLARLKDRRFNFLCQPGNFNGVNLDLGDLVKQWIGHDSPLTVFDLGGVPSEITDLVVALISRILFEVCFWGRSLPGIGKMGPLFIVFEEAHLYLPRGEGGRFLQGFARRAVQRLFKEGRKYGVGGMVVSQRPSELDDTVLSQCGTFFALRLSTPEDQARVKAIVPDALAGLLDVLPALRTGEAIVMGEAVTIPSRIKVPLVDPRPRSDDPEVGKRWKEERIENPSFEEAVSGWRVQQEAEVDN
jgi:hypothetical protein